MREFCCHISDVGKQMLLGVTYDLVGFLYKSTDVL